MKLIEKEKSKRHIIDCESVESNKERRVYDNPDATDTYIIPECIKKSITEIEKWSKRPKFYDFNHESITELRTFIIREMFDHNHAALSQLRSMLTPVAAGLHDRLMEIPLACRQAAEISAINNILQGYLFIIEEDDLDQEFKC